MTASASHAVSVLDEVRRALDETVDLAQVRSVHDQAVELLFRIRMSRWGLSLLNQATEVKLRYERRMGRLLATLDAVKSAACQDHSSIVQL